MRNSLFAKKPLQLLLEEMKGEHRLRRVLGPVADPGHPRHPHLGRGQERRRAAHQAQGEEDDQHGRKDEPGGAGGRAKTAHRHARFLRATRVSRLALATPRGVS